VVRTCAYGIAIVALLLASATPATALPWGVKAGVSLAGQDLGEYGPEVDGRTGLHAGVYVVAVQRGRFALLVEASYVQKGMKSTDYVSDPDEPNISEVEFDNRVDYISVPVLAEFSLSDGDIAPYVAGGIRCDFLLGYDSEWLIQYQYEDLSSLDFGYDIAAGIRTGSVLFEARYSGAFGESFSESGEAVTITNSAVLLSVGTRF